MKGRPLIFGEVLFDTFPDGSAALGGAPFNVAWHLQGFGQRPLFISRVGEDERGGAALAAMRDWGLDTAALQCDPRHPTGVVDIALEHGQPSFTILAQQAYDYIDADAALASVAGAEIGLIYHGTLALRTEVSRAALQALRTQVPAAACVDINLRPPWWDHALVEDVLRDVYWAKLNDAELLALADEADAADGDPLRMSRRLRERCGIATLVVTRGEHGALMLTAAGDHQGAPPPVAGLVDTVGAGDAFSAVALLGLLRGWPLARTLDRALEFAAMICAVRGAVVRDRLVYADLLRRWEAG